ncbi:hypothetical protein J2TS6_26670 [Paenibacillus albilobatus]|uniref:Uncharacterized protein n=1 Tax=Paenibacillus albilobatus TaxID=2716884 RepID=A0A920C9Q9_9BACL|nr:hypothetical protein J2TS6_26670 [Paenibacillus albilobatus]
MAILFNLHADMNMLHRQFSRAKRREESGYVYFSGFVGPVKDAECFFFAFLEAYREAAFRVAVMLRVDGSVCPRMNE